MNSGKSPTHDDQGSDRKKRSEQACVDDENLESVYNSSRPSKI